MFSTFISIHKNWKISSKFEIAFLLDFQIREFRKDLFFYPVSYHHLGGKKRLKQPCHFKYVVSFILFYLKGANSFSCSRQFFFFMQQVILQQKRSFQSPVNSLSTSFEDHRKKGKTLFQYFFDAQLLQRYCTFSTCLSFAVACFYILFFFVLLFQKWKVFFTRPFSNFKEDIFVTLLFLLPYLWQLFQ